jgi:hypothetical protein
MENSPRGEKALGQDGTLIAQLSSIGGEATLFFALLRLLFILR